DLFPYKNLLRPAQAHMSLLRSPEGPSRKKSLLLSAKAIFKHPLRGCMRIHSAANKSHLFPYKTFFELHKLNLSLLRPPERSSRKKTWLLAAKAMHIHPLKQPGVRKNNPYKVSAIAACDGKPDASNEPTSIADVVFDGRGDRKLVGGWTPNGSGCAECC
ncbi:MAG: hypothetical protein K1000chlam3_01006, partial [Chlamydiae bacterium]|nr:hypothetical protein [Chlamydiota bacterium]